MVSKEENRGNGKLRAADDELRELAAEIGQNAIEHRRLALGSIEALLACSDMFCQDFQEALKEEKSYLEGELQEAGVGADDAAAIAEEPPALAAVVDRGIVKSIFAGAVEKHAGEIKRFEGVVYEAVCFLLDTNKKCGDAYVDDDLVTELTHRRGILEESMYGGDKAAEDDSESNRQGDGEHLVLSNVA